jgi:hypothetical protein
MFPMTLLIFLSIVKNFISREQISFHSHLSLRKTVSRSKKNKEESRQSKLWGSLEDLERTVGFILAAGETT